MSPMKHAATFASCGSLEEGTWLVASMGSMIRQKEERWENVCSD